MSSSAKGMRRHGALCTEDGENWREVWSRELILVIGTSLECHSSTPPCHANALLLERLTSQWYALRCLVHAVVRSQWSCRRRGWLVTSQPPLHVHFYMPMGAKGPASQLITCSTWGVLFTVDAAGVLCSQTGVECGRFDSITCLVTFDP